MAREIKATRLRDAKVDMDRRTFEGYAATWDRDRVGDIIKRGAFKKSISEGLPSGRIKVLWLHSDPLGMPLEMSEDSKGLKVKARVSATRLGDEALELMRDGVVDSLSIGYSVPEGKAEWDDDGRTIKEIKLYEFSPVVFPANEAAVITGVKDIERVIRGEASPQEAARLVKALEEIIALVKGQPSGEDTGENVRQPHDVSQIIATFEELKGLSARKQQGD